MQHNDDDRETTSTQMQRGVAQTLEDLYDVLARNQRPSTPSSTASYYTQLPQWFEEIGI